MPQMIGGWIKTLLLDNNVQAREKAAQLLGESGPSSAKAAIPALIQALEDENEKVRGAAAFALAKFGPAAKTAVPVLIQMIENAVDICGSWGAVHALGAIGADAAPAVPRLILLLRHGGMIARQIVPEALGKIGPAAQAAIPALIEALQSDKRAGAKAAEALGRMESAAEPAIPALIAALGYDDRVAVQAVTALGRLGLFVVPHFAALLHKAQSTDWTERDRANTVLRILGLLVKKANLPLLLTLRDGNDVTRFYAAVSLWNINRRNDLDLLREIERVLIEALDSPDNEVRFEAVQTLGDMQDLADRLAAHAMLREMHEEETQFSPVRTALLRALDDPLHAVRKAAAEALWKSDCAVTLEALQRLLRNGGAASVTAAEILWEKDHRRMEEIGPVLIAALKGANFAARHLALKVLGRMGSAAKPVVAPLCAALYDSDARVRVAAAGALGALGDLAKPDALAALPPALRDPAAQVRVRAAEALWLLDSDCAVAPPILLAALEAGEYALFGDADAMISRMRNLGIVALPALLAVLPHGPDSLRISAAEACGAMGARAPSAIPVLLQTVQAGPLSVRLAAAIALWKINRQANPALPVILEALESKTLSRVRRWQIFEVLGQMGPLAKTAVPALSAVAQAGDYHMARLATAVLEKIG